MNRATTFAIDFTFFEFAMKAFLFLGGLTCANKTDQLPSVMMLEMFQ